MRSERKIVTVLFADIKGSIDLVARRDPEQAGEMLAEVVAQMSEAVHRFGGVVNQVMGDGVMALFGAPLAIEDHAVQACQAALAMRSAVQTNVLPRVQVRIGLSSGEVVVRGVSGDVALHYSAAGEAVHFASRMEQVARPDQIVLTPATRVLAGDRAEVRSLGAVAVKGLEAPMEAFELLRVVKRRTRRGQRFVGRDREMAQLQDALDHADAGEARAVRVIADAGAGKSRLVREFTAERLPEDWALCQAEAPPHRRTSYGVVVELLTAVFGLAPDDDVELRREKVLSRLALPRGQAQAELMPPLAGLLRLGRAGLEGVGARERRQRTIEAAAAAMQQVSLRHKMALVVEDAHWLDPESAESIQRLGAKLPGQRMLAIATERPPQTSFLDASDWMACYLPSLDAEGTHALLQGLLLPGPDVPALERKLIAHTQGNPLFLEEVLQSLLETGELVRDGERFRLVRPVERLRVPDSVRGLLDARVDRLVPLEKDVLQAAAVVGPSVPVDVLRRVVDVDEAELASVLGRLCAAGFLLEAGTAAGDARLVPRYVFRHGLIHDAAYNGILLRSRVRMHGAVLDALEQRGGNPADADLLADHASKAEAWPKAVTYSRLAASRALDRYANPESARYYEQALAAATQLPDSPDNERTLLKLHIDIRWPLFRLGHVRALRPHLDEAAALADRHEDHEQVGLSHALRSHVLWLAGDPDGAEAAADAARRIARAHGDHDLAMRAQFQSALVHVSASRVQPTVAALQEVLDHIGRPPQVRRYRLDAELAVTALGYVTRAHASAGQFALAWAAVAEATGYAEASTSQQNWIFVHTARGVLLTAEGRPQAAVRELERARDLCVKADIRLLRPVCQGFLALALVESGQAAHGLDQAREAVEQAEQMGFLALHPLRLGILAQAHLMLDAPEQAAVTAERARDLAIRIKEPGAEAYATGLLGEAALRRGQDATAQRLLAAGMAQADSLGLHPLAACLRQRLEAPDNRAHPWLDGVALAP
ncbi:MAG: adenylate/guanylate cyclase domain-containing protein [Acetobacteraceae bacterium]